MSSFENIVVKVVQVGDMMSRFNQFRSKASMIEGWFNIIAPAGKNLAVLQDELRTLKDKNWQEIHA